MPFLKAWRGWEGSGVPFRGSGRVGRPSQMARRGREARMGAGRGLEALPKGREGLVGPSRGSGWNTTPSRKAGRGWEWSGNPFSGAGQS